MPMNAYTKGDAFYFPLRVFYEDTDAGGVVYHANYFNFCERARTEWLRQLTVGREKLLSEHDLLFVVRRAIIEWKRPARLDNLLLIETRLSAIGKVRMTFRQTITRDGVVLAIIDIEVVAVNSAFAPTQLPTELLDLLPSAPAMEEPKRTPKE